MVFILNKGDSQKKIKKINDKLGELSVKKKLDAKKFCGKIRLKESPLAIQKMLRNEWG